MEIRSHPTLKGPESFDAARPTRSGAIHPMQMFMGTHFTCQMLEFESRKIADLIGDSASVSEHDP